MTSPKKNPITQMVYLRRSCHYRNRLLLLSGQCYDQSYCHSPTPTSTKKKPTRKQLKRWVKPPTHHKLKLHKKSQNCVKAAIAFVCTICKRQLLFALLRLITFVCTSAIEHILCTTVIVNFCMH